MANELSVLKATKDTPIINFYKEKCIFLSGGTGFLGTVNDLIILNCLLPSYSCNLIMLIIEQVL